MLIIKKGNLLEATENLLMHQVNEYGSMGGGLALQIANRYPSVEKEYQEYVEDKKAYGLLNHFLISHINDTQAIVNCFTQWKFETQYGAIKEVFTYLKHYAKENGLSIAMPFKYGCGIAKGDFTEILEILSDIFTDYDITIYRFKEE